MNAKAAATVSYTYDDLGRVSFAQDNAVPIVLSQGYTLDRYGNNRKGGQPYSWIPPNGYDANTNRYVASGTCSSGIAYDNDGNLLCDTFHTYTWDAEDRLASVDAKTLTRDAFGRVIESQTWGGTYEVVHGPAGDAWFFGQTFAWMKLPVPGGGSARYVSGSIQAFNHPDWEGNSRLSTTPSRTYYSSTEYAPFGEAYDAGTSSFVWTLAFNGGSNRDMFPDMYDTPNRELHPIQGRWIQPDPAGLAAVDPSNPQTWNRYAYVGNNPLSRVDPTGLLMISACEWDRSCGGGGGNDASGDGNYGLSAQFGAGDVMMDGQAVSASLGEAALASGAGVICEQCQPGQRVDAVDSIWGWVKNTPSSGVTGMGSAAGVQSSVVSYNINVATYWGVVGGVADIFQQSSAFCSFFCGPNGNDVFDRSYPLHPAPTSSVSAVTPPTKPTLQQIASWCMTATYVSMGGSGWTGSSASSFVDQPNFNMDTIFGNRDMNAEGNSAGSAAGNAAAFIGTLNSCMGGAMQYH